MFAYGFIRYVYFVFMGIVLVCVFVTDLLIFVFLVIYCLQLRARLFVIAWFTFLVDFNSFLLIYLLVFIVVC